MNAARLQQRMKDPLFRVNVRDHYEQHEKEVDRMIDRGDYRYTHHHRCEARLAFALMGDWNTFARLCAKL